MFQASNHQFTLALASICLLHAAPSYAKDKSVSVHSTEVQAVTGTRKVMLASGEILESTYRLEDSARINEEIGSSNLPRAGVRIYDPTIARDERRRLQARANKLQMFYYALSAVDAAQTIYAISTGRAAELNPLFGKRPSAARVLAVKGVLGAAQYVGFRVLNRDNPRSAYRVALMGLIAQGGLVGLNMRVLGREKNSKLATTSN